MPFPTTNRKFEVLWHTSLLWKPFQLYHRMPMGLNISPAIWESYINAILNCLQSRKCCEAIMDNPMLFTPTKSSYFDKLEDLLKALCKNGLKISPKKCQLFKTDLQYMGNTIFIRNKKSMHKMLEKSNRGNSETRASYNNQRLSKFCGYGEFC